jgi:hypothetical protein
VPALQIAKQVIINRFFFDSSRKGLPLTPTRRIGASKLPDCPSFMPVLRWHNSRFLARCHEQRLN